MAQAISGRAVRAEARAARRGAHPRRGHERPARRRHVTDVTKEIARLTAAPPRVNQEQATLGATAVDQLRAITTEWFNFYNGYDPLFTWWMGMPYAKLDEALKSVRRAAAQQGGGREPLACRRRRRRRTRSRAAPQLKFAGRAGPRTRSSRCRRTRCATSSRASAARRRRWRTRWTGRGRGQRTVRDVRVLHELAGGAEVARLRQAVAQRAGRLPLHSPHRRDANRARESEARSESAAEDRHDRHPRPGARPRRAAFRICRKR